MSVVDLELTKFTLSVLEAAKQPMYYYNYYSLLLFINYATPYDRSLSHVSSGNSGGQ